MSVKKSVVIVLAMMFILPLVFASTTDITIKAPAQHEVFVTILDPAQVYYSIQSFPRITGETGEFTINFTSDIQTFDVAILLKKDGKKISYERLPETYITGAPIFINLVDNATEPVSVSPEEVIENVTQNVTSDTETTNTSVPVSPTESNTQIESDSVEESSGISGSTILNVKELLSSKITYYIGVGIVLALLVVVFVLFRGVKDPFKEFASSKHQSKVKSLEILPRNSGSYVSPSEQNHQLKMRDSEIKNAERKLDEARKALDRLRL